MVRSVLIQVMCAYSYLALNHGFSHGDLELRNVLVKYIDLEAQPRYRVLIYVVGHMAYIVPTHGIVYVLCDLDTACLEGGRRVQTVHGDVLRFMEVLGRTTGVEELRGVAQSYSCRPSRYAPVWLLSECGLGKPIDVTADRLSKWLDWQEQGCATLLFVHGGVQTRLRARTGPAESQLTEQV